MKEKTESSFNIEANIDSSEILIENIGSTILTNISAIKDEKEVIQRVVKLNIGESESIYIPGISGINLEKEELTTQNEGWLAITCDQGVEKKMVYWYVVRHAPTPNTQEVLIYRVFPLILIVLSVVIIIFWVRKKGFRK